MSPETIFTLVVGGLSTAVSVLFAALLKSQDARTKRAELLNDTMLPILENVSRALEGQNAQSKEILEINRTVLATLTRPSSGRRSQ